MVTRCPPRPASHDPDAAASRVGRTNTGSVIARITRREAAGNILRTEWTSSVRVIPVWQGRRRCAVRFLEDPHPDDTERPAHLVWIRSASLSVETEDDVWQRLAKGLMPAYDPNPAASGAD
eukprot:jgi/Tetstr1/460407/TSEL_000084.t1